MATPTRSRLRAQLFLVAVAAVVSVAGAFVWARFVERDGAAADDEVRLETPGEYVERAGTVPPVRTDEWPAVELIGPHGERATLVPDGRPMVVNFWYSSCPPCTRELADFADVDDEVSPDDVRFVGVNPLDSPDVMTRFAGDRGVTYELWRDDGADLADELGVVSYPTTVFVDADGRILASTGTLDDAALRDRLSALWSIS